MILAFKDIMARPVVDISHSAAARAAIESMQTKRVRSLVSKKPGRNDAYSMATEADMIHLAATTGNNPSTIGVKRSFRQCCTCILTITTTVVRKFIKVFVARGTHRVLAIERCIRTGIISVNQVLLPTKADSLTSLKEELAQAVLQHVQSS